MSGVPDTDHWAGRRVAVTGGAGFLGRPTVKLLTDAGAEVRVVRSAEHDLRDPAACAHALAGAQVVIHLAARVGGIDLNRRLPAQLAHDNLLLGANVFEAARGAGVEKLVAASSVCVYPQRSDVPLREDAVWLGYPEPTTAPYGMAKKMLSVLCDAYRRQHGMDSCVPVITNIYGPGDSFDLDNSHAVAAMVRKFVDARRTGSGEVVLWGSGAATREFLYVDDAARAIVLAAERYSSSEPINVGTGQESTIRRLAETIARLTEFEGETVWDTARPEGQARRFMDVSRAREEMGFVAEVGLEEGLRRTVAGYEAMAEETG